MKNVVISGSIKLQDKINYWINHFEDKGYKILDYPRPVKSENCENELLEICKDFYKNIEKTDIYFLMNETKDGIDGYIGASAIAELTYVVMLNLIHNKNIEIFILNKPNKEVFSYDEVIFWLKTGLIKIYNKDV